MSWSLNLSALPAHDFAILGSQWVGYSPLNNRSIAPIEVTISELKDFVDLNQSYLSLDVMLPTNANHPDLYMDGRATEASANQIGG